MGKEKIKNTLHGGGKMDMKTVILGRRSIRRFNPYLYPNYWICKVEISELFSR